MDISVIIPSYNTRDLLDRCLRTIEASLAGSGISYEIIIIDNTSSDGTIEMLTENHPAAVIIRNTENVGYGKANNQGLAKAEGTFILFLNSDIEVHGKAIPVLYRYILSRKTTKDSNRRSDVARGYFIGGKLVNPDGSPQPSAGPFFSLPVTFAMLFLKGDTIGVSRSSPPDVRTVDWVSGACIMAAKKDVLECGAFDESIFMYMDEIDLLYRAKLQGYRTIFHSGAVFTHVGAASSGDRQTPVANIFRGLVRFYRKYHPPWQRAVLAIMLRWKARLGMVLGRLTGNTALRKTYEAAYRMV